MTQRTEIKEKTQGEELAEARSLREKMKRLLENEDFRVLIAHMQLKLDQTVLNVFIPPQSVDSELLNLYRRGESAGYQDAMNFVHLLLNGAEGTIAQLAPMFETIDEDEDDNENAER